MNSARFEKYRLYAGSCDLDRPETLNPKRDFIFANIVGALLSPMRA